MTPDPGNPITWPDVQWSQLSYASLARLPGQSRGGWGVLENQRTPPPALPELLTWTSPRSISDVQLGRFADAQELRRRPVRLRSGKLDNLSVVAHAVDAGLDSTGRPGNVMSHVAATTGATPRSIELWGSPDWLAPYGEEAVSTSRLPGALRPGPLDRDAVLAWIRSSDALLSLGWVLDAVEHARRSDAQVVLATRTPDEAAHWIAAITHLTSRAAAATLGWSTCEDASSFGTAVVGSLLIVGMSPRATSALLPGQRTVLIDPSWQVRPVTPSETALAQGSWPLPDGRDLPLGLWQHVMLDLVWLQERAGEVLEQCDRLGDELGPRRGQLSTQPPLYWELAVALLQTEGAHVQQRADLLRAILLEAPVETPEALLDTLLDEFGDSATPTDWRALTTAANHELRSVAAANLADPTHHDTHDDHDRAHHDQAQDDHDQAQADPDRADANRLAVEAYRVACSRTGTQEWVAQACQVWAEAAAAGDVVEPARRVLLGKVAELLILDGTLHAAVTAPVAAAIREALT